MGKSLQKRLRSIIRFFPIQLFLLQFKRNVLLVFFWLVLFAIITHNFGLGIGLNYLFLDPEYLNQISFFSMLFVGIAFGIFCMSYFITTYILNSKLYNFLGTIRYPFLTFCINNSLLPLLFSILYLYNFIDFQMKNSLCSFSEILVRCLGFILGVAFILSIIFFYFRYTFKFFFKDIVINVDKRLRKRKISRINILQQIRKSREGEYQIEGYINSKFQHKKVSLSSNHDLERVLKVFDQHHINAISVELIIFIMISILGAFRHSPSFQIPAAASGLLLFSFLVMFFGAFSYWLKKWSFVGIVFTLLTLNFAIKKQWLDTQYPAFGLNYTAEKANYTLASLDSIGSKENFESDYAHTLEILENWKAKFPKDTKPKMIFLCASGGGQRSCTWAVRTLQYADSLLGGELMRHTFLITGASGGLIGNTYYRDLYLQKQLGNIQDITHRKYFDNISKDMLNPMIFSLVVNDLFLRYREFEYNGFSYKQGRGFAFEHQLNLNTEGVFLDKVTDYAQYEYEAKIPMTIIAPVVINDARKMYISAQPISYMTTISPSGSERIAIRKHGTELRRFLAHQNGESLKMLSALRMGATFPYVTPNVSLPTKPRVEIMDAGLSDNYGISDAEKFLYVFRDWISENTGGVIFISIRDSELNPPVSEQAAPTLWGNFFKPVGSLYAVWDYLQDYRNISSLERSAKWFDGEIDFIPFQYPVGTISSQKDGERKAVLSWHLTRKEKESIRKEIYSPRNQASAKKLVSLLQD